MNYLQDPPQSGILSEVVGWLATPQISKTYEKWILVDGAVLGEELINSLIKRCPSARIRNVFECTEFSSYGKFAPYLFRLSNEYGTKNWLSWLLDRSSGQPATAILDATGDIDNLSNTLYWLARANTQDGVEMYCRFADTRITPELMKVLSADQRAMLENDIDRWQILDRQGMLHSVLVTRELASVAPKSSSDSDRNVKKFVLSDQQFLSMMAWARLTRFSA